MNWNRISARQIGLLLVATVFLELAAFAQGVIVPRPCERPEHRCPPPSIWPEIPRTLKVKSIRFTTKITEQVAVTHVEQVFENNTAYTLEGVYFFPLPDNVSITEFAMWDGERRLVGEVRSREEARQIYNQIVRSQRDPALLEYAGKNLFQASVFPIAPRSDKKIELTYSQVLSNESGMVAYKYPLGTGWRAYGQVPRRPVPLPGPQPRQAPVEEQEQIDPRLDASFSTNISGQIEIHSRLPIKGVYSPSHQLEVKRDGEQVARASFETRASSAQSDFQLFYTLSNEDFGVSLLTYREPGKDGYFLLLVSPKAELKKGEVVAKDVLFVLDTSGSMASAGKMDKAKAALRFGVEQLDARDRFNIISFAGEEHLLHEGMKLANKEAKALALEFIEKMRATGGTNINDAMLAGLKQLQRSERPQIVVLITDGQPTVGETKAQRIMGNVKESNSVRARVFTFGVGYDVNTVLLDGLANDNRGSVEYIEPNEDIEIKVSNFFAKINHPVLSDLKLDFAGVSTAQVYPRILPDLFHGSQLVLVGRYQSARGEPRVTLTGNVNGRERRFNYDDLAFSEQATGQDFLPHLWAMRRVGHLLDQIKLNGEAKELRDEIVELGTRYGIVTPYTSYLVQEPGTRLIGGNATPRQMRKSPERPAPEARDALSAVAGQEAVVLSKDKERLRQAEQVKTQPTVVANSGRRRVADKTFTLKEGIWQDDEFSAERQLPVVRLKFASDEYFDLISKEPKLAEYFALGERVVVVWNGKVFRVEE